MNPNWNHYLQPEAYQGFLLLLRVGESSRNLGPCKAEGPSVIYTTRQTIIMATVQEILNHPPGIVLRALHILNLISFTIHLKERCSYCPIL